ncbi:hypothetical protein EYF80_003283 [Liparis tanakae]|uniref:Uncharacterized protein n=1 Tax=Liparis tanakae TaxID=230148 RepID=A0A4Z2J9Y5_9TELE|nr:hypothetical protein EYF80_003283 [Liparis tanakae]
MYSSNASLHSSVRVTPPPLSENTETGLELAHINTPQSHRLNSLLSHNHIGDGIIRATTLKPGGILLRCDRLPSPGSNSLSPSPAPILSRGS